MFIIFSLKERMLHISRRKENGDIRIYELICKHKSERHLTRSQKLFMDSSHEMLVCLR